MLQWALESALDSLLTEDVYTVLYTQKGVMCSCLGTIETKTSREYVHSMETV